MLTPAGEISLVRESSSDETDEELERIAEEEVGDGLPFLTSSYLKKIAGSVIKFTDICNC